MGHISMEQQNLEDHREAEAIDFDAHYAVAGHAGIAFYLIGYGTMEYYEGDFLICDNPECDHAMSEMCWSEGDTSLITDHDWVRAVMVGDDRVHEIDVDDLTMIEEDDYCHECGQIGCGHYH